MVDAVNLLHANGYHMRVETEPLDTAMERIGRTDAGQVTSIRRLTLR